MNKVELWLNAIINEDGHKMSAGSLRTIEMLRSEFKRLQNLQQTDVSGTLPPVEAISFAQWLKHLDNGDVHYNPLTKAESPSIGFSPFDCFVDDVYTVEELYRRWKELGSNDR